MHTENRGQVGGGRGSKLTKEGRREWTRACTQRTEGRGEEGKGSMLTMEGRQEGQWQLNGHLEAGEKKQDTHT